MASQSYTEMIDDVAAFGEQFRKFAEATTEQTRQTLHVAQEQFQQNLTKAQQAQNDIAPMVLRLNEQNNLLVTTAFNSFWDAALLLNKITAWGQEQSECVLLQRIEQGRRIREEGGTLLCETIEQARRSQAELYHQTQECLRVGFFYAGKTARREGETTR